VPSTTVAPEGASVQVMRQVASSPATETISALASIESPTITGAAKFNAMLPIRRVGPPSWLRQVVARPATASSNATMLDAPAFLALTAST